MKEGIKYEVVGGAIIGALAWIDPLFIPLVVLGPIAWGGLEGWRGRPWTWVLGVWAFAGVTMIVSDWLVNREDVVFHIVLTVVMALLAGLSWLGSNLLARRRGRIAPEAAG